MIKFKDVLLNTAVTTARVVVRNVKRPLRPEHTKNKVEIPGKVGSWDFGGNVAKDFLIEVTVGLNATSTANLWTAVEAVATWANGKGELEFTDNSSKKYLAQVYSLIEIDRPVAKAGTIRIIFECDAGYVPAPPPE